MAAILNYHEIRKIFPKAIIDDDKSRLRPDVYLLRRRMERFDLELTAYLSRDDNSKNQKSFEFITSNICAGGAFFKTDTPLTVGTRAKLAIVLPLGKFKNVKHKKTHIHVSGSVIRTDQQGMAVSFDRKYKILPQ